MSELTIRRSANRLQVNRPTRSVTVVLGGPQGPAGPPGLDGGLILTAVDMPTGQIQVNYGLELGDTEWLNISGSLINGWTGTDLYIRRIASVVFVKGSINASAATNNTFFVPTNGFKHTTVAGQQSYFVSMEASTMRRGTIGNSFAIAALGDVNDQTFAFSYPTNDGWPLSLPGPQV